MESLLFFQFCQATISGRVPAEAFADQHWGSAALAYVYLLACLVAHARCYSYLGTHRCAYLVPTVVYPLRFEFASNLMHQIVSQQGNKYVFFDTVCFLMVNRPHTQL